MYALLATGAFTNAACVLALASIATAAAHFRKVNFIGFSRFSGCDALLKHNACLKNKT
jgi:hypothetical protein